MSRALCAFVGVKEEEPVARAVQRAGPHAKAELRHPSAGHDRRVEQPSRERRLRSRHADNGESRSRPQIALELAALKRPGM
jgi:hypothetical protein